MTTVFALILVAAVVVAWLLVVRHHRRLDAYYAQVVERGRAAHGDDYAESLKAIADVPGFGIHPIGSWLLDAEIGRDEQ